MDKSCRLVFVLTVALTISQGVAAAGILVSFEPDTTCALFDETLTVQVVVDTSANEFDTYETLIRFDPGILTFVSVQEDTLMATVCGSTFWWTDFGSDYVLISHAAICGGPGVTGTGAVCSLTFEAPSFAALAELDFEYFTCYRIGEPIPDVTAQDGLFVTSPICPAEGACCWFDGSCVVATPQECQDLGGFFKEFFSTCDPNPCLTMDTPPSRPPSGLHLLPAHPNPSQQAVRLAYACDDDCRLHAAIYDCSGRAVRLLYNGVSAAGWQRLTWNGRDNQGLAVPEGTYYCRLQTDREQRVQPIVICR